MRIPRGILFDSGQTLVYSPRSRKAVVRDFARKYCPGVSDEAADHAYSVGSQFHDERYLGMKTIEEARELSHKTCRVMAECLGARVYADELIEMMETRAMKRPYPEVEAVLATLSSKYDLGVVSNHTAELAHLYEKLGLRHHFKIIITSAPFGREKPHPTIFLAGAAALACEPEEVVFVGDNYETDICGSRSVGMQPVLIDRSGRYCDADCPWIRDLSELPRLLGGHRP